MYLPTSMYIRTFSPLSLWMSWKQQPDLRETPILTSRSYIYLLTSFMRGFFRSNTRSINAPITPMANPPPTQTRRYPAYNLHRPRPRPWWWTHLGDRGQNLPGVETPEVWEEAAWTTNTWLVRVQPRVCHRWRLCHLFKSPPPVLPWRCTPTLTKASWAEWTFSEPLWRDPMM